jgi:hypothetical protein
MKFSEAIKEHIENMICSVHDIHPIVEQDWQGITVIACCDDFHKECIEQAEMQMAKMSKSSNIENA